MALATIDLAQRETVRLISTGRLKDPVLLPLAANHGALQDLAALESVTNGRLQAELVGLPGLHPRELEGIHCRECGPTNWRVACSPIPGLMRRDSVITP